MGNLQLSSIGVEALMIATSMSQQYVHWLRRRYIDISIRPRMG